MGAARVRLSGRRKFNWRILLCGHVGGGTDRRVAMMHAQKPAENLRVAEAISSLW
jgi:hypothetical protein